MKMTFKNAVMASTSRTANVTRTTNGMKALKSSLSNTIDLFFKIGASRGKDITGQFAKAYGENREMSLRVAQWARDVRGGAGERELYRQVLKYLEKNHKDDLLGTRILENTAEIGRWDDLLIFTDADVKAKAYGMIREALEAGNGLCAKWMPRKGPVALELRNAFGWSPKYYRKRLVELTKVVETQMCAKEFDSINFSHVPSLAMSRYSKAFGRNAPDAFTSYKEALKKGDPKIAKVNAGAVYPYDIVKNVRRGDAALADEQWKALPNFIGDASILPIVDVSGSMTCPAGGYGSKSDVTCLDVAVSLGLYCSDKNTGPFKDVWLTFSSKPKFKHATGTLSQKVHEMANDRDWEMSTNLHAAFDEILRVAVKNNVASEDMPKVLLIMSDMQFNCCHGYDDRAIQMIRRKYNDADYEMPAVVFWNLNAADNVPVKFDEKGTALVSGFSPSIMKSVLAADMDGFTPEAIMKKAVSSERYAL
jgi:Domain of unknown function (DUF2828)